MSNTIQHISLDFWNTVGIPNPEYAMLRGLRMAEIDGGRGNRTPRQCNAIYKAFKKETDEEVAKWKHCPTDYCFMCFSSIMNWDLSYAQITRFKADLWDAFVACPPTILDQTVEQITRLKDKGISFSIGSNTNFIPGIILEEAVLGYLGLFDFMIFSDEVGCSKPTRKFFDSIDDHITKTKRYFIGANRVLHIGDSPIFDLEPASKYGFKSALVSSPYDLPSILAQY